MKPENEDMGQISKFETVAVITLILAGFAAFGYGAFAVVRNVVNKHSVKSGAAQKALNDTIDLKTAIKLNDTVRQR